MSTYRERKTERQFPAGTEKKELSRDLRVRLLVERKRWHPQDMEIFPCHPLSFMAAHGSDISSQVRWCFICEHPLEKKKSLK